MLKISENRLMKNSLGAFLLLVLALAGCKEKLVEPVQPSTLTARITAPATVAHGLTVDLSGANSTDSQNKPFTYTWSLLRKPAGSTATIVGAQAATATFVADKVGEYEVQLTIANATGGASQAKAVVTALSGPVPTEAVVLGAPIEADRELVDIFEDPTKADYVVPGNLEVRAKLTIRPGVVIEVAAAREIQVTPAGTLVAKGEANKRIVFTGQGKTKGYWRGLVIRSAQPLNELDYVDIQYAGGGPLTGFSSAQATNLGVYGQEAAQLKVTNTNLSHSAGYGLYAQIGGKITGFANNSFSHNTGRSLALELANLHVLDAASRITGSNGGNVVEVLGSELNSPIETVWPAFDDQSAFYIHGDLVVSSGLRLSPGSVLKMNQAKKIMVEPNGYLIAKGTNEKKIVITGADNSLGYWRGILFKSADIRNELEHVEVKFAGSSPLDGFGSEQLASIALLGATEGRVSMAHTAVSYSGGYGLYVQQGALLQRFQQNSFQHMVKAGVALGANQVGKLDRNSVFIGSNGFDGVEVYGSNLSAPGETTWPVYRYHLTGDLEISSGLRLQDGTVFEINRDKRISVEEAGYLVAKGADQSKIIFRGKEQTKGFWRGILVKSANSLNEMDHVTIMHGGSGPLPGFSSNRAANVALFAHTGARLKLTNSSLQGSGGWGVVAETGSVINADAATSNAYQDNTAGTIKLQ